MPGCDFGAFASSSDLLFDSHSGRLQADTPLSVLCRFAEPPLFERDLYFAILALVYRASSSPQAVLDEDDRELLRRGQIVETWRKLQDPTIKDELAPLFGLTAGGVVQVRNDFAHFNMLNPRRSRGATIDLTAQVNAARRLMAYDRKLKNALTQSVIELAEREGLHLNWQMPQSSGEHVLVDARVRAKQAPHLRNLGLFETGQGERGKPAYHLTLPRTCPANI